MWRERGGCVKVNNTPQFFMYWGGLKLILEVLNVSWYYQLKCKFCLGGGGYWINCTSLLPLDPSPNPTIIWTKPNLHHFCTTFVNFGVIKMREMRGERKPLKKRWRISHFYDFTGIKSGTKVVQIGLRRKKVFFSFYVTPSDTFDTLTYLARKKLVNCFGWGSYSINLYQPKMYKTRMASSISVHWRQIKSVDEQKTNGGIVILSTAFEDS